MRQVEIIQWLPNRKVASRNSLGKPRNLRRRAIARPPKYLSPFPLWKCADIRETRFSLCPNGQLTTNSACERRTGQRDLGTLDATCERAIIWYERLATLELPKGPISSACLSRALDFTIVESCLHGPRGPYKDGRRDRPATGGIAITVRSTEIVWL
jgi:hypothetical protein